MAEKRGRRIPPATTPEEREAQLTLLATDLLEQRLRDGTATAAETIAALRLGTERERLEREKLVHENAKLVAQTEAVEAEKQTGELYKKALAAMRSYQGFDSSDEENDDY